MLPAVECQQRRQAFREWIIALPVFKTLRLSPSNTNQAHPLPN